MSDLRWKILAWVPAIVNLGIGAAILWFASGLEHGWGRDLNMIIAGANFGVALAGATTLLYRQRYQHKEDEWDKQQLSAFKAELEGMRNQLFDAVMMNAAREIERLTDGQITLRRIEKDDKRLH